MWDIFIFHWFCAYNNKSGPVHKIQQKINDSPFCASWANIIRNPCWRIKTLITSQPFQTLFMIRFSQQLMHQQVSGHPRPASSSKLFYRPLRSLLTTAFLQHLPADGITWGWMIAQEVRCAETGLLEGSFRLNGLGESSRSTPPRESGLFRRLIPFFIPSFLRGRRLS